MKLKCGQKLQTNVMDNSHKLQSHFSNTFFIYFKVRCNIHVPIHMGSPWNQTQLETGYTGNTSESGGFSPLPFSGLLYVLPLTYLEIKEA